MNTTARDVMTPNVMTLKEGTSLEEAIKALINKKITGMPVVDSKNRMIGIISEYDVLKQFSAAKDFKSVDFSAPVEFTRKVNAVSDTASLSEIISLFLNAKYRRLPVVDLEGKLLGIITRRDLMRIYYYRAKLT